MNSDEIVEFGVTLHVQTFATGNVHVFAMRTNSENEYRVEGLTFTTQTELVVGKKEALERIFHSIADTFCGSVNYEHETNNPERYFATKSQAVEGFFQRLENLSENPE